MSLKRFAGRNASFYKWKTNQCLVFDPHEGAAHSGDPAFIKLWSGFSEENHLDLAPFLPSERQLTEREREMCRPSGFPDHTTFRNLTSVLVKQQNFLTRQEKKKTNLILLLFDVEKMSLLICLFEKLEMNLYLPCA